jgi:hypothetical protein
MMHIAYPNVVSQRFAGCGRYLALPVEETLGEPYRVVEPNMPNRSVIYEVLHRLVPEWVQVATTMEMYEKTDERGPDGKSLYAGASLDLAYFLALTRYTRRLVLEPLQGVGDIWCTGKIDCRGGLPRLDNVDLRALTVKLQGFLEQEQDRLFVCQRATAGPSTPASSGITVSPYSP